MDFNALVVLGTTASGKTKLAVQIAHYLQTEIISVDSRQIYTGMDIGTGKDLNEYKINGKLIPYHLIDILPAGSTYHVHQFRQDFEVVFNQLMLQEKIPVLCGGTAMYLDAVLNQYEFTNIPIDIELRNSLATLSKEVLAQKIGLYNEHPYKIDLHSKKRMIRALEILQFLAYHKAPIQSDLKINALHIGLKLDPAKRRQKIKERLLKRIEEGMIAEVEQLLNRGITAESLQYYGLEYRYIIDLLNKKLNYQDFLFQLEAAIYRFSKRQQLFFNKMEREGMKIHWFDASLATDELLEMVKKIIH